MMTTNEILVSQALRKTAAADPENVGPDVPLAVKTQRILLAFERVVNAAIAQEQAGNQDASSRLLRELAGKENAARARAKRLLEKALHQ